MSRPLGPKPSHPAPTLHRRDGLANWRRAALLAGTILLGLALGRLVILIAQPLAWFILGLTLITALAPPVNWLDRRLPRWLAVVLVYLVLLALVGAALWFLIPPLVSQVVQVVSAIPGAIQQLQMLVRGIPGLGQVDLANLISSQLSNLGSKLVSLPLAILTNLVEGIVIFFFSLYWLILVPDASRAGLSLFPPARRPQVESLFAAAGQAMGGYLRGAVLDGVIVGAIAYVGYLLIGVNYPVVLAALAALLEFLPTVGPLIAGAAAILVALLQSPLQALIVLLFIIGLQQLEYQLLVPNIMRSQTDISPLLVILALLLGNALGGLMGVLVAIPLAAALHVFVERVVAPGVKRWTGAEESEDREQGTENKNQN